MKLTSTILFDFITDFKIVRDDIGVCFDAVINFKAGPRDFNIRSEIFMESIIEKSIDSIYLLNPVARKYKLPTFFNDVNHQFLYQPYKALIIDGNMPLFGNYRISIFPKSRKGTLVTLAELRAKKYN